MGIRIIETRVGGARWEMNTLPATIGLRCLTQLAAIVGAPAGAAAGGAKDGGIKDLDSGMLGEAVAKMAQQIAEPGTIDLIKDLLVNVRKNDKPVEFDDEFAANYGILSELLMWSLRENFGSFLAGNSLLGGLAKKAMTSMSAPSTGESGES